MQPLCGCLCYINRSYKATSLQSGCNFSSKHFLIEKNGFDLLEKNCDELLLSFNFPVFLLLDNQNNFTYQQRKTKGIGRKQIGREYPSLHCWASEIDPSISICLVKIEIRNYKQSLQDVHGFGKLHSVWLQTFLTWLMESIDIPKGCFRVRGWLRYFVFPSDRSQPSPLPEGGAWADWAPNFNFGSTNIAKCSLCVHVYDCE